MTGNGTKPGILLGARSMGVAAVCLLGLAAMFAAPRAALAQGGVCTQACQTAFAQCYKDTGSNRKLCETRLQQCLSGCIDKR
jgi:hypothetical protein